MSKHSDIQGLLLHPSQHSEGPPGLTMDQNPAALLRNRSQESLLLVPGVLHGQVPDQHNDQPRHTGGLWWGNVPGMYTHLFYNYSMKFIKGSFWILMDQTQRQDEFKDRLNNNYLGFYYNICLTWCISRHNLVNYG